MFLLTVAIILNVVLTFLLLKKINENIDEVKVNVFELGRSISRSGESRFDGEPNYGTTVTGDEYIRGIKSDKFTGHCGFENHNHNAER